ncbi:hypothetical protein ACFL5N_01520, partial [bacterium]
IEMGKAILKVYTQEKIDTNEEYFLEKKLEIYLNGGENFLNKNKNMTKADETNLAEVATYYGKVDELKDKELKEKYKEIVDALKINDKKLEEKLKYYLFLIEIEQDQNFKKLKEENKEPLLKSLEVYNKKILDEKKFIKDIIEITNNTNNDIVTGIINGMKKGAFKYTYTDKVYHPIQNGIKNLLQKTTKKNKEIMEEIILTGNGSLLKGNVNVFRKVDFKKDTSDILNTNNVDELLTKMKTIEDQIPTAVKKQKKKLNTTYKVYQQIISDRHKGEIISWAFPTTNPDAALIVRKKKGYDYYKFRTLTSIEEFKFRLQDLGVSAVKISLKPKSPQKGKTKGAFTMKVSDFEASVKEVNKENVLDFVSLMKSYKVKAGVNALKVKVTGMKSFKMSNSYTAFRGLQALFEYLREFTKNTLEPVLNPAGVLNYLKKKVIDPLTEDDVIKDLKDRATTRNWKVNFKISKLYDFATIQGEQAKTIDTKLTLYFTTGMIEALRNIKKVLGKQEYDKLLDEIFLHEKTELDKSKELWNEFNTKGVEQFITNHASDLNDEEKNLLRQTGDPAKVIARMAHRFAEKTAGTSQEELIKVMGSIDYLQTIKSLSAKDTTLFWKEIEKIKKAMQTIAGQTKVITDRDVFNAFPNANKVFAKYIANENKEPVEVVVDISGVKANQIGSLLANKGLLEDGNLKSNITLVLAGDMANPGEKNAVENACKFVKDLKQECGRGSSVSWVIGGALLKASNENTDRGKQLRELTEDAVIKAVYRLSNGYLLTGAGVIGEDVRKEIKKNTTKDDGTTIENFINTILVFRAQMGNELGADLIVPLKDTDTFAKRLKNITQKTEFNKKEIEKLLNLSEELIYEKKGIIQNTTPAKDLNQITVNKNITLPAEVTQLKKDIVNDEKKIKGKEAPAKIMQTKGGTTVSIEVTLGNMQKINDVRKIEEKKIADIKLASTQRVELDPIKTTDLIMMKIQGYALSAIKLGLDTVKATALYDKLIGKNIKDKNQRERYKAIAAAA